MHKAALTVEMNFLDQKNILRPLPAHFTCPAVEPVDFVDENDNGVWEKRSSSLHEVVLQGDYKARLVFAKSDTARDCTFLRRANLFPDEFQAVLHEDLNGCFRWGYRDNTKNDGLKGDFHESWLCFKIKHVNDAMGKKPFQAGYSYSWRQMTIFISWNLSTRQHLICLLNCPDELQNLFSDLLPPAEMRSPYTLHSIFLREAVRLYDRSIWSFRNIVREIEKSRNSLPRAGVSSNFPQLHDLARHIVHSMETLDIVVHTIHRVLDEQTLSKNQFHGDSGGDRGRSRLVGPYEWERREMSFLLDELHALKTRAWSLNQRLHNEINLAFNLTSQLHGKNAQDDSSVMKIIGIVSLLYLPGMFVAGIFGMNLVDTQEHHGKTVTVYRNFWLYWSITIPLTAATLLVWAVWHYREFVRQVLGQR